MKKLLLIAGLLAPTLCFGQYSIPWFKISGGGGTSSGGPYTLMASIGQPDATMTMSGGPFSVNGGFWSLVAVVQSVGTPTLSINVTAPGTATVSWPAAAAGFVFQQNASLSAGAWANVSATVNVLNGQNQVTISTKPGNNFFRLIHQ